MVGSQGMMVGLVGFALLPRRRPLHGNARLATRREIEQAGLLNDNGIILGRLGRRYMVLPGQQGVELEAPPRSGKPLDAAMISQRVSNPTYRSRFRRSEGRIGLAEGA